MSRVFYDTNVLVYAVDEGTAEKHHIAHDCLRRANQGDDGVLSTQVMQEFYVNVTRKLGVKPEPARFMTRDLTRFEVVTVSVPLIDAAMQLSADRQLSFWDALIVSAALAADCDTLLTEDLNTGERFDGLTLVNPFAQAS